MTHKAQLKKRQHHIPKFYLERFASPTTKDQIWNYDKVTGRVWLASSENTSCESHLYSITADDGSRITDIEDALCKIETAAAPLFQLLIAGCELSDNQRYDFANFLAMMFVRTIFFVGSMRRCMPTDGC